MRNALRLLSGCFAMVGVAALFAVPAYSHCDGMDGPVVKAAQQALAAGDVSLVLIWVQKDDEAAIRTAFDQTMAVRKLGTQAQELADTYFFETLVRIHRAGEGAPYTGLKPAGRDLGPAIPAADQALESGDVKPLADLLGKQMHAGLEERFRHAREARAYQSGDVTAGREYVKRYVMFIHYAEGVHQAAEGAAGAHPGEEEASAHAHE